MKVGFIYGPWCVGNRTFDFNNLLSASRGLTGSEMSCFMYARDLARRGHDVTLFVPGPNRIDWDGVKLADIGQLPTQAPSFDAMCGWNEPDQLRCVPPNVFRVINQQLNDFSYCQPDYDQFVDAYTSPSQSHLEFTRGLTPSPHKWCVLPNGCDPTDFDQNATVPFRVIYASSPDRGLHLLLQAWPAIKKAVPQAHLRIFYNMAQWMSHFVGHENHQNADFRELSRRARYTQLALQRMTHLDVTQVGSVSRAQIAREMSEACVLAYPCDTIRFTEGFSVTTMEACASNTIPIISAVDSLGQIYGGAVPMVPAPARNHIPALTELVIRGLIDEKFRMEALSRTRELASRHTWSGIGGQLERLLIANRRG